MQHASAPLGIGIDTGGTFTDIVLFDLASQQILRKAKTPTTHGDYTICIGKAFAALQLQPGEPQRLRRVALSTTLATNTVAEQKVHPTALVVEPGDISVPDTLHPQLVLLRSEVGFDAQELVPVSAEEVLEKCRPLDAGVEGYAVSGYASTRNPAHEQQIAAILRKAFKKPVVLGSELTHQLNFMQRAQAAALNAGLLPVILEWLRAVKSILAELEIACSLYIVKGDGSLMEEAEALERPVQTLFSGPAASLQGGRFLSGEPDAIVIDVGGTTTDIGRVHGGRGQLRRGGILINHRQIAVDGLDIATFGLGGDSRLRLLGPGRYRFENQRVLPFCRAADRYPGFSVAALEAELADQWHFGDPDLLELAGLDQYRPERLRDDTLSEPQRAILAALGEGPRRVRALGQQLAVPRFAAEVAELVRRRLIVRVALTPTDLFCAAGRAPQFSQEAARHVLRLYARMLDLDAGDFQEVLAGTARRQATAVLASFLAEYGPPLTPGDPLMERLTDLMLTPEEAAGPHLAFDPRAKVVLVGAGAPVLFESVPEAMARRLVMHPDGDVANAVGAITSQFLLRESVSIEPVKRGGVELFDHHGKRPFPSLADALEEAHTLLRETLHARATALGLRDPHFELHEDVLEDYADFSRRARKELIIARVEALLTGMPG
ncbi:MAG TPA: hydantoinase/oxoprolinase family protein [bacterium]|nr:hydantoinase/oxoprolinase family protein [bacterium]